MKHIDLTQGYFAKVDDEDVERISKHKWCVLTRKNSGKCYAIRTETKNGKKKNIYMHQAVLRRKIKIIHENKDCLDNRKQNLKRATNSQVTAAAIVKKEGRSSQYIGVSWARHANKWRVHIMKDQISKHLGYFTDEILAAKTYDKASLEVHGPFGVRNFP